MTICPISYEPMPHAWAVVHKNSKHHFSLEAISAWIESQEFPVCPLCRRAIKKVEYDPAMSELIHKELGLKFIPDKRVYTHIPKDQIFIELIEPPPVGYMRGIAGMVSMLVATVCLFQAIELSKTNCRPFQMTAVCEIGAFSFLFSLFLALEH